MRAVLWVVAAGCGGAEPHHHGPRAGDACDPVTQDCAGGLRCTVPQDVLGLPYPTAWDPMPVPITPAVCVEPTGHGAPGDPCTADPDAGTDDCGPGGFCLTVDADRTTGTCVALCNPAVPDCAAEDLPGDRCLGAYSGAPGLCFEPAADLGDPECPDGTAPSLWYGFPIYGLVPVCAPVGDGAVGDPCGAARCGAGSGCVFDRCRQFCTIETEDQCDEDYCEVWNATLAPWGICSLTGGGPL